MSKNNYMTKPHIYKITNKINQKFYYGVHNGSNTEKYMGSGKALHQAYKKYGIENFIKEILLWFDTVEEAYEYEAVIVTEKMIDNPQCYNMQTGGKGGITPSEETKQKQSEANKGKKHTQETLEKMSIANSGENNGFYGKTHSEETKQKMSEKAKIHSIGENNGMYGKTHSQETKDKISEKAKIHSAGENNGFYGKNHSEETRQKMSEKKQNQPLIQCPYCDKIAKKSSNMSRYHFNNCRHNTNKQS